MYYNKNNLYEYNECSGRGMCSIFPAISSFQEVMLIIFRTMCYYVLKLEKHNVDCSEIKKTIISGISSLISSTGYQDEQLLDIIADNYNNLIRLKQKFKNHCEAQNIKCRDIKLMLKLSPNMALSDVLTLGHRLIINKNKKMNSIQKCFSEILFVAVKSVALSMDKLFDYGIMNNQASDIIVTALNIFNYGLFPVNKAKILIAKLSKCDLVLWKMREEIQHKTFGKVVKTAVSLSTQPGKAILVSGSSLCELEKILSYFKNEKIDIYTHGDLLISHAYEKFKEFENLKGHFGSSTDDCILDFATFPGAIVLTKHAAQNIEYLIRGRLFSTCDIAPKGVVKINDYNFEQVLTAAKSAKGFSKGRKKSPITVGFDFDEIKNIIDTLSEKFNSGTISRLFIIGMSNYTQEQAEYFNKFLNLMPKNCFAVSFSYDYKCENLLYLNIANNFPLQLKILNMLFEKIPVKSDKIVFFVTKCDSNTISIMISLKEQGAQNIYLSNCPPTIINPAVMTQFMKSYVINQITYAQNDLEKILQ